jgi:hypothetical protein
MDFADQLEDVSTQCAHLKKAELHHFEDKKKLKSSQTIEKLEAEVSFAQNRYRTIERWDFFECPCLCSWLCLH